MIWDGPWHGVCADCGGPISKALEGPCAVPHRFDRDGRLVRCGLKRSLPKGTLARLGMEGHEWDGGWFHTDPNGNCVCRHPKHDDDCEACRRDVGRFLAGWHAYTPWDRIERDHEAVYRAAVAVGE